LKKTVSNSPYILSLYFCIYWEKHEGFPYETKVGYTIDIGVISDKNEIWKGKILNE
jgi:hypothetical protein